MKDILPSMPKGEIVGNMAIAEMTQTVKVVIDGNRLVIVIDDGNWLVGYMKKHDRAQENWQKKLDDVRAISKWGR
jgi:hypothetical protein